MARPPVAESIHELVGGTPIVRLRPVEPDGGAAIYPKHGLPAVEAEAVAP